MAIGAESGTTLRSVIGRALIAARTLLCLCVALVPATGHAAQTNLSAALEGCTFEWRGEVQFVCEYPEPTYEISLPRSPAAGTAIPVVVLFHDAGSSGKELLAQSDLTERFNAAGIAVIAPNGLPRRSMRFELYDNGRPGSLEGAMRWAFPVWFDEKRLAIRRKDGVVGRMYYSDEGLGWYYRKVDLALYRHVKPSRTMETEYIRREPVGPDEVIETDYIGRDEIASLRKVLSNAARDHRTAKRPLLIGGIGHGASLVWDFACYAPKMADLFAPVGGAFWHELPSDCEPGARLTYTHANGDQFWPLDGAEGSRQLYERIGVPDSLNLLRNLNACAEASPSAASVGPGVVTTASNGCRTGGPFELLRHDSGPGIPDWWAGAMLSRIGQTAAAPEPEPPPTTGPVFRRIGEGLPGATTPGAIFRRVAPRGGPGTSG